MAAESGVVGNGGTLNRAATDSALVEVPMSHGPLVSGGSAVLQNGDGEGSLLEQPQQRRGVRGAVAAAVAAARRRSEGFI